MNSTYSKTLSVTFLASEADLKKIHKLLQDRIGPVTITAECADEVTRTFDSIKQLCDYENLPKQELSRIRFASYSTSEVAGTEMKDFSKSATVDFRARWLFNGVNIDIDARDDVLARLRTELEDKPSNYLIRVNRQPCSAEQVLQEGDRVRDFVFCDRLSHIVLLGDPVDR